MSDNYRGGKGRGQPTGTYWWDHRSYFECGDCGKRFLSAERLIADLKKHEAARVSIPFAKRRKQGGGS